MSSSVHIVIVNWNTGDHLRECLASISKGSSTEVTIARVTVVDNASVDGSADGAADVPFPLEVVRNDANVGFAAACNQGAAESTADYLLFLNPDTQLFPETLITVTRFMESPESRGIGICGAQSVDAHGRPMSSCSRLPTPGILFGKMTGLHRVLPSLFPSHHLAPGELYESQIVDQVIGAFYFVRRELFDELGGFDERYFMYFEDVDFALRARQRGDRSYFLADARVFHAGNVSSSQVRDARLYYSLRSRFLFLYRHWPRSQARLVVALTFTVELGARLFSAGLRRSRSDISATADAYRRLLRDLVGLGRNRTSAEPNGRSSASGLC